MNIGPTIGNELRARFPGTEFVPQPTRDEIPTFWVAKEKVHDVLRYLKTDANPPYRMLYDLTAIDERARTHCLDQPDSDFTVVYHLLSFQRNEYACVKTALK